MAMMRASRSLKHFQELVEAGSDFPFYGALLYAPVNGLNAKLHEYTKSHWQLMDALTGRNCLLLAVEDIDEGPAIEQYRPQDIYDIARQLGALVSAIPCIILFTEPRARNETLVLRLKEFLGDTSDVTDEGLTDFFQSLAAIIDSCSGREQNGRLECLRRGLDEEWPPESSWHEDATKATGWIVPSITTAATVFQAFNTIATVIKTVTG